MPIAPSQQSASDASAWVRRHAAKIANASNSKPLLDVACGAGRNALLLAQLGCQVIGIDIDVSKAVTNERFQVQCIDVDTQPWPFREDEIGGIIQVHFLRCALFTQFAFSLAVGGYLLIETVPGCGGNYLELPKAGELYALLSADFALEEYRERKVGPKFFDAVTVRTLARRR